MAQGTDDFAASNVARLARVPSEKIRPFALEIRDFNDAIPYRITATIVVKNDRAYLTIEHIDPHIRQIDIQGIESADACFQPYSRTYLDIEHPSVPDLSGDGNLATFALAPFDETGDGAQTLGYGVRLYGSFFGDRPSELVCRLDARRIVAETFTSRHIEFATNLTEAQEESLGWSGQSGSRSVPYRLFVDVNAVRPDGLRITDKAHGFVTTNAFIDVDGFAAETLEINWASSIAEQQEIVILVLVGALVAVGAAAAIEALRPYVTRTGLRAAFAPFAGALSAMLRIVKRK